MQKKKVDIVSFLEKFFVLENGKPIKIQPWQKENIFDPIFNDVDEAGLRKRISR